VKSVKDYIPHREPFLFVDRVLELDESHVTTELTLRPEMDFFKGHYPDQPIMPGVLMCEAVFQSAAIYMSHLSEGKSENSGTPVLSKIGQARFKRMVTPGDTIQIEVTPLEHKGAFHLMRGKILNSSDQMVMNVEFTITAK